jgi:hypothetical protein
MGPLAGPADQSQADLDIILDSRARAMESHDIKVAEVAVLARQQAHYLLQDSLEEMPEIFQAQAETVIYYLGILHIMLVAVAVVPSIMLQLATLV